jgi:hypothetical protein
MAKYCEIERGESIQVGDHSVKLLFIDGPNARVELEPSGMTVDISTGSRMQLGNGISVRMESRSGRHARFEIIAPRTEKIKIVV